MAVKKLPNIEKGKPVDALEYEGEVKKSYVPEGFKSQEDFLEDMRSEYQSDIDYDRPNRDEALDDKRFTAGDQWDADVLETRKGLPCLVINSVPQFVAQLVGDWREERPAVKVVPSEDGDTEIASIRGDLIRGIEMRSRASRVYDNSFESTVTCGDGAFRVAVEYAKGDIFDQEIFVRPIDDALSVVWDRLSVDPTGRDARHVFVDDLLPKKEFERKWPDHDPSTLNERTVASLRLGGWWDDAGVRVTEYWRMIERDRLLVLFEDGAVIPVEKNLNDLVAIHGTPQKTRLAPCLYAQMHLVTGFAILAGPFEYKLNRPPIIRMTGRTVNVGGKRIRYGLVRFMKDPVRLKNFWRSVAAEQLGYAPKAQWLATESAVEGREDEFRKAHLSRDPLLIANDEAEFGKNLVQIPPPTPEAALLNEAQVNAQDMKDVTGIHDASLGIRSNETSGKAIQSRQREGDIASLTYYDNGNASILESGDVINQLINTIYDATRIIRIVGEDQAIKFMKINDPNDPRSPDLSIGNYDVALTTGPSYTTRRVEAAEAMMNAVQVYPEIMQVAGDLVVKAQDWPGAEKLAERLKKTIPPQFLDPEDQDQSSMPQGMDPQMVQQMMAEGQAELQKLDEENKMLKLENKNKVEENKLGWYKARTDRIKALSDHEVDANAQALEVIDKLNEQDNLDTDREREDYHAEADRLHQSTEAERDRGIQQEENDKTREHTASENESNRKAASEQAKAKAKQSSPSKKG